MRNIKVSVAYDGTDFVGWQNQATGRSVQGVLEAALAKIHKHPVTIYGAGRTDSGVHAAGQVFNFYSDIAAIPEERYAPALNRLLPSDVRALCSGGVEETFNSRRDARFREYRYYIYPGRPLPPWLRRYCWDRAAGGLRRMNAMAAFLPGRRDFTSFAAVGDTNPAKVKDVYSAGFYPSGPFIVFRITGNAFLWRMVRNIVGTITELAGDGAAPEVFRDILAAKKSLHAGMTAPARGLFLHKVLYGGDAQAAVY
ncbi:MAG: tRNA pseudouridine(38-40) synthase TruA [Spirochaetales bacterium]|jgi:tRNA pseudouridine38-40 synthase|nr:tRNA pseudouridine(38-40) synthase TruA [Spirochaetales bacterium]